MDPNHRNLTNAGNNWQKILPEEISCMDIFTPERKYSTEKHICTMDIFAFPKGKEIITVPERKQITANNSSTNDC